MRRHDGKKGSYQTTIEKYRKHIERRILIISAKFNKKT